MGGLTLAVVLGGGQHPLVDVVGQEALQSVVEGTERRLVVGMQHGALVLVQLLQETGGKEKKRGGGGVFAKENSPFPARRVNTGRKRRV